MTLSSIERAVPQIGDGLETTNTRRILHSWRSAWTTDATNKVANIVGHTMQFHPSWRRLYQRRARTTRTEKSAHRHAGQLGAISSQNESTAAPDISRRASRSCTWAGLQLPRPPNGENELRRTQQRARDPAREVSAAAGTEIADGIAVGLSSKVLPHNFNEFATAMTTSKARSFILLRLPHRPGVIDIEQIQRRTAWRRSARQSQNRQTRQQDRSLVIHEVPYTRRLP